jgi:hypothetical protein
LLGVCGAVVVVVVGGGLVKGSTRGPSSVMFFCRALAATLVRSLLRRTPRSPGGKGRGGGIQLVDLVCVCVGGGGGW